MVGIVGVVRDWRVIVIMCDDGREGLRSPVELFILLI